MSVNPCKHGDREKDQNNNFVNAAAHGGAGIDREGRARRASARTATAFAGDPDHHQQTRSAGSRGSSYSSQQAPRTGDGVGPVGGGAPGGPQVTAKVMWGNVSAIKELRDKEQSERQLGTRAAGRRQ